MLRKLFKKESKTLEDSLSQMGLPFESLEAAVAHYEGERSKSSSRIEQLAEAHTEFSGDYSPGSLLELEALYFSMYVDKSITPDMEEGAFLELIDYYMRRVFVDEQMAEWSVQENHFAEGSFQEGIEYGYGTWTTGNYSSRIQKKKSDRRALYTHFQEFVPDDEE